MKKIIILLLMLLAVYFVFTALTGCSSSSARDRFLDTVGTVRAKVQCISSFSSNVDFGQLSIIRVDNMYKVGDIIKRNRLDWKILEIEGPKAPEYAYYITLTGDGTAEKDSVELFDAANNRYVGRASIVGTVLDSLILEDNN